jgi:hypothetical protein
MLDGDVWLDGDGHDIVMRAIGRLNREDQYVIVLGNELLDKPQNDATLRFVGNADIVGSASLSERIGDKIETEGRAKVESVIKDIRADETVFLPPDETENAARDAVTDFLVDNYVLETGGHYHTSLGDRDPTTATLVPTVADRIGGQIIEYIEELDPGESFKVPTVAERFDSSITDGAVRTFLLQNLGREEEPEYVVGPTGSEDAADWVNGYPFRIPESGG